MTYINQIRAFYDWMELNPISPTAINLWHAIMHIANKSGWKQDFSCAISTLELKTGLNKQAVIRARNQLVQFGRISVKSRAGNQSAIYTLIPLVEQKDFCFVTQTDAQSDTQADTQSDHQMIRKVIPLLDKTKTRQDYQLIADLYNATCVSFPKCTSLSEARKKAIGARFSSGRTEDDFKALFQKAQASSFLKGANSRSWRASFDWLIKDANMAKVLDGNYDNENLQEVQGRGFDF